MEGNTGGSKELAYVAACKHYKMNGRESLRVQGGDKRNFLSESFLLFKNFMHKYSVFHQITPHFLPQTSPYFCTISPSGI